MLMALRRRKRWPLDFVSDALGASRKFHMLAVNDDCCREDLYLMADTSFLVQVLSRSWMRLAGLWQATPYCQWSRH